MLLQKQAQFNDLSPKLRNELEEKIKGFGKVVRYRLNISHANPAPMGTHDKIIYPSIYTLDPTVFNINDPYEDRPEHQKSKKIALISSAEPNEKGGIDYRYKKVRLEGKFMGILRLDLENDDDFNVAMFLELHPKLTGGMFSDKNRQQMVSRIDEEAHSKSQRTARNLRLQASKVAQEMSDMEVVNFADAMMWDSTEDVDTVLRNKVEALADESPEFFNDLVNGKSIEYQALVKKSLDRGIILFDPAEYKYYYASNNQTITLLNSTGTKNEVEKLSEWLMAGGKQADQVYKKLKSLNEEPIAV